MARQRQSRGEKKWRAVTSCRCIFGGPCKEGVLGCLLAIDCCSLKSGSDGWEGASRDEDRETTSTGLACAWTAAVLWTNTATYYTRGSNNAVAEDAGEGQARYMQRNPPPQVEALQERVSLCLGVGENWGRNNVCFLFFLALRLVEGKKGCHPGMMMATP
ncbi:unnamed protein product [Ectocarpus sp. 8 AP-2014]